MKVAMTLVQWSLWAFGLIASLAVLAVIGFGKGGPDWYLPVFVVAAGYCLVANIVSLYLRRRGVKIPRSGSWVEAFSTARLGLLALIALAVFVLILFGLFKTGAV